jgi:hypothetical protein
MVRNTTSVLRVATGTPLAVVTKTEIRAGMRPSFIYVLACSLSAQLLCEASHVARGAGLEAVKVIVALV